MAPDDGAPQGRLLPHPAAGELPSTQVCDRDLVSEIETLKADGTVPLGTMGSLSVARQLINAGLVDRLRLMTFPLVAGPAGREAAFAELVSADLELVDHRVLDGRVLLVEYRPTGRDIPRLSPGRSAALVAALAREPVPTR